LRPALCRTAAHLLALAVWAAGALPAQAGTLEKVRERGHVVCGVGDGPPGYSVLNGQGGWSGISIDFCRALASAVLGSKDAVKFLILPPSERLAALQKGEVDLLSRADSMTSSRDTALGVRFPGVLVYDGQGFLMRKSQGVASALELSGGRICITVETADEHGIADFFGRLKMAVELVRFEKWADAVMAYANKSCQVLSAPVSMLAQARQQLADAQEHILLPEVASKMAVGPVVRQGDEEWFSVVRWTLHALVAAEELGISAANADTVKSSGSAEAKRFLAFDLDFGKQVGLGNDWTLRVVKQVGNYGELFDRHLGSKSPLKLERRLNNLWNHGGLHYAPPFR
jgi:general L-amino acid transport system substrate-binding protein